MIFSINLFSSSISFIKICFSSENRYLSKKTKARTKDKEGLGKEQADEDQFKWQADEDADEYLPEEMQSTNSKRHTHPYQRHLQ